MDVYIDVETRRQSCCHSGFKLPAAAWQSRDKQCIPASHRRVRKHFLKAVKIFKTGASEFSVTQANLLEVKMWTSGGHLPEPPMTVSWSLSAQAEVDGATDVAAE
jgi:phage-related protein